ncbi:MAG TPA: hypothetical protein VGL46_09595 [Pseudonocardiaceae bacterium]|jgi:transposase-like protein
MTISQTQRQQTEDRIRAAADRLLSGQIPPGGGCDIVTLARESGVSRAALYRSYGHLKAEFDQRLTRLRDEGHQPDPRAAQILRLKDENRELRQRLVDMEQRNTDLTEFKTSAISRLTAQHDEITRLRAALTGFNNVRVLTPPEPLPVGITS